MSSWIKGLILVAGLFWAISFVASGRPLEDWPVTLLYIAGVPAYALWLITRWRILWIITFVWCILQALVSACFILFTLISYMDPVLTVGVKAFGLTIFTLNGLGQIAIYFAIRGVFFLLIPPILRRATPRVTQAIEETPNKAGRTNLP
jgi:hypothetical protein